ncbi:MAG: porin [Pseudomonadota bacterium]
MTLAKRLLLGSAAAVVATTGAQAADLGLPVAPAVDYVQICEVAGMTGFILPGSDVCFDINGFARFQAEFFSDFIPNDGLDNTLTFLQERGVDDEYNFEGVFELNFDARTMTEWGLLRGFIRIDSTGGNNGDSNVLLQKAFIQIGGLTAGYTDSFFDPVYTDYALGETDAADGGATDLALIGYAFSFGNGVTLLASLEEGPNRRNGFAGLNPGAVPALVFGQLAGNDVFDNDDSVPDFVAALLLEQAWGSAKLSGAIGELDPNDIRSGPAGAVEIDSEFGYAIGASVEIGLPFGVDSVFGAFALYGHGMNGYTGTPFFDALIDASGDVKLTTTYSLGAGVEIGLTPQLDWELDAYYSHVDHDTDIAAIDADASVFAVRTSLAYTPINNLEFRAGVGYTTFDDSDIAGLDLLTQRGNIVDFTPGVDDTDDIFAAGFRITRSF